MGSQNAEATTLDLTEGARTHLPGERESEHLTIASAAHELLGALSCPMVSLRAVLGQGSRLSGKQRRLLMGALTELEDLSVLVEGLLATSARRGRPELELRPVDIVPLIHQVGQQPMWSRDHDIELSLQGECFAMADPPHLKRVVSNLLVNATKYGPRGSTISLGVERAGEYAVVTVADEGPGLKEDFDIFEAGTRGETKAEGYGLGLYIVRTLVEAHGGRVWAEPRSSTGARFRFVLRLAESRRTTTHRRTGA